MEQEQNNLRHRTAGNLRQRIAGNLKLKVSWVYVIHYLLISLSNSNGLPPQFSFPGTDLVSPYLSTCLCFINISDENFSNLFNAEVAISLPRTRWHLSLLPLPFPGDAFQPFGHSSHFQGKETYSCQQFGYCNPGFIRPEQVCTATPYDYLVFT